MADPFEPPECGDAAARQAAADPIREMRLLIYTRDWQRMYDYAQRNRLGDSATVIRRLLDLAEAEEAP